MRERLDHAGTTASELSGNVLERVPGLIDAADGARARLRSDLPELGPSVQAGLRRVESLADALSDRDHGAPRHQRSWGRQLLLWVVVGVIAGFALKRVLGSHGDVANEDDWSDYESRDFSLTDRPQAAGVPDQSSHRNGDEGDLAADQTSTAESGHEESV
jgi:hypothetical protein